MKAEYAKTQQRARNDGNSQQKSVTAFAEDEVAERARTSAVAAGQTARRVGRTAVQNTPQSADELKRQAQITKAKIDKAKTTAAKNRAAGEAWLKDVLSKNSSVKKTPSGLAYEIKHSGNKVRVADEDKVEILYVGKRIDGYLEPTALLTRNAAQALKQVSDYVKAKGYRLKIFDAYRPQRAVDNFMQWAEDLNATEMKPYFYPELNKDVLIPDYIARKSGHTRGSTIDLTLFDMKTEKEVDMGCTFDWFGVESHPDFCGNPNTGKYTGGKSKAGRSITAKQFKNRMILREAMMRFGFKPLDTEWWHFTLKDEPYPNTYFTFPVKTIVR